MISKVKKITSRLRHRKKLDLKGGWPGLSVLPNVDVLVDVGIGQQGTFGLYSYFPNSNYIFIDPLIETKQSVQKLLNEQTASEFHCCALGATEGFININVRHPLSRSGVHNMDGDGLLEQREVEMKTLDAITQPIGIQKTIGIKVDVEGYELEVLFGAQATLDRAKFVILELPIGGPRFKGSYTFEEAIFFMNKNNFKVAAIRTSGDGTNHCDIGFVKDE